MPTTLPDRTCEVCQRKLTRQQIHKHNKTCSYSCHRASRGLAEIRSIPEPVNDREKAAFDLMIVDGMRRVRRQLDYVLFRQTPLDDSPEAERRLREVLCVGEYEVDDAA